MTSFIRTQFLIIFLVVMGGCNFAPDYEQPALPVDNYYPTPPIETPDDSSSPSVSADAIGWREFFKDKRLQALIELAIHHNRDLKTAILKIEEARLLYQVQNTDLFPTIGINAFYNRTKTAQNLTPANTPSLSNRFEGTLNITAYELDVFGRVRNLTDAAYAQYQASAEAWRATHIALVAEVANAYFMERSLYEQLEVSKRILQARKEYYILIKQRYEIGISDALTLKEQETSFRAAEVAVNQLTWQWAQALNALTLLVGKSFRDLPTPTLLSAQQFLQNLRAHLPSDLLLRRPDIRQAEQLLIAANANIGAARAAFFPSITLSTSYGTANNELSNFFKSGTEVWTVAPQLLVSIFDWGRNMDNLDLSKIRNEMAITQYEKVIQTAFREVADALTARGALDAQLQAQTLYRNAASERLNLVEKVLHNGINSNLDFLDAQRDLLGAELSLIQVQQLCLSNTINLYKALGGGIYETLHVEVAQKGRS